MDTTVECRERSGTRRPFTIEHNVTNNGGTLKTISGGFPGGECERAAGKGLLGVVGKAAVLLKIVEGQE